MLILAGLVTTFMVLHNQVIPDNELVSGILSLIIVSACAAIDEQHRAKERKKKAKEDDRY
ncbi:MAG: hypothetical protein OXG84_03030 [Chloroflexi bacterium]|nr:hypothetical protein [Chloroflexota bacterium]